MTSTVDTLNQNVSIHHISEK